MRVGILLKYQLLLLLLLLIIDKKPLASRLSAVLTISRACASKQVSPVCAGVQSAFRHACQLVPISCLTISSTIEHFLQVCGLEKLSLYNVAPTRENCTSSQYHSCWRLVKNSKNSKESSRLLQSLSYGQVCGHCLSTQTANRINLFHASFVLILLNKRGLQHCTLFYYCAKM